MFKLNINAGGKKIIYKPFSISLKYLINGKKFLLGLNSIIKISSVKVSELQMRNFVGESGSELKIARPSGKPDELILTKVNLDRNFSADYFRNHLAGFLPSVEKTEVKHLHIFIPDYKILKEYFKDEEYYYQSFIEGIFLGNYSFDKYFSAKNEPALLNVFFYAEDNKKLKNAVHRAETVMDAVYFTRDLQNEPAVNLTPDDLAERISARLKKAGVKVKTFDEKEIKKMKMGGLLAVGSGSSNPPRFVVAEYIGTGSGKNPGKKIALVGKGITFDSGGISIKPAANMGEMKGDMSGAAAVAGAVLAAANAKLPVHVYGIMPSAENMPSGKSMRPGDIVISSSGKSIEIDNTDAEGRVILSDALNYASKLKPAIIIDLATLTGACKVALGDFAAGLFTKDQKLSAELYNTGLKTFERLWPMPMWDEYSSLIKSDVADVKNTGGRWGGAITAAKFLENFVGAKIPWAHIDIAGTATANSLNNYSKKYMTGFGVRLLFEYLSGL